ncbi:MAG: hypothetical protein PF542_03940 [Nanoarchaeota archaeon]|jgi:hypothetical protein|nr:hypothetical protein [Nanoarchaeota archaeon]
MNFDKIVENFSEKVQSDFVRVCSVLEEEFPPFSSNIEKDVASTILSMVEETRLNENSVMKTSYVIANSFKQYSFDERIVQSIDIFSELQIPYEFHEGKEFEYWDKAKDYLLMFLDDEDLPALEVSDEELDLVIAD